MANTFKPFHIHKSKNKQFYFTIVSTNGYVLATSETYTRRSNCIKGIMAVANPFIEWFNASTTPIDDYVQNEY